MTSKDKPINAGPINAAPINAGPQITEDTPERARRRQIGLTISVIGIIILIPMMVSAVLIEENRGLFALLALASWIVWKIGRAMMKMNSPGELR